MKLITIFTTLVTSIISITTPINQIKKTSNFENFQINESWGLGIKVGQQETSAIYSLKEPNYNFVSAIEKKSISILI